MLTLLFYYSESGIRSAIALIENGATYAQKYGKILSRWAEHLLKNELDTDAQPCIDNVSGSCPPNANLCIKRILGLGHDTNIDSFSRFNLSKKKAFYLTKLNKYGLSLGSKHEYTRTDWSAWVASLAKDKESFRKLIEFLHRFMHETSDRVLMSNLAHIKKNVREAFAAWPVVRSIYMKILQK